MPVQEVQECVEGDAVMTYYEKYMAAREKCDLKGMVKHDVAIIGIFFANNEDRLKAIEDAANRVLREKGWDSRE